MKLGARIFKTGIAIVFALFLAEFYNCRIQYLQESRPFLPFNLLFIDPI